jgi:potassium efflux system protein
VGFKLALVIAAWLVCDGAWSASARQVATPPASSTNSAASAKTNAAAVPLAEVAAQAEAAFASLQSIEASLSSDRITTTIQQELPLLTQETNLRLEENSRLLTLNPSLEMLRRLDREWREIRDELAGWKRSLTKRVAQVDGDRVRVVQLKQAWEATRASGPELKMPAIVLGQVERVISALDRTLEKVEAEEGAVLTLQTRVTEQDGRVLHALATIGRSREAAISHILVRDSPPIWSRQFWSAPQSLLQEGHHWLALQVQALRGYVERTESRFVLHAAIFLALLCLLIGASRELRRRSGADVGSGARIFDAPCATALVLSLFASSWIYTQAPRLFLAISGAAALIPTTLVARKLINRRLYPVLNALVAFYFIDQLRMVAASQAVPSRLLFLAEMMGGALLASWLLLSARLSDAPEQGPSWRMMKTGCRVALGLFVATFLTNAVGYMGLSKLVGHALQQSAYMALSLYALIRILGGLFSLALSLSPLARLDLVKGHRESLQSRVFGIMEWLAIVLWATYVLEALSLRAPVFQDLRQVLAATWQAGSFKISLGDILSFGLTVWAAFLISQLLRFILEVEVYPRVQLAPGLHYSISKMANYAILLIGFFVGLAIVGFDLTHLTILVGAFGVGLGFGLQNIINNFVSGLILLFERPIKLGDVVQVGANEGVVKRIGIRASIIRIANGAELIVPNGALISETVTNWTLSDRLRRIDLPVPVAGPADAARVMELLRAAAVTRPLITKDPPPQVLLTSFSGDTLNFELRFWANQSEDWLRIRSEVALAVRAALAQQNIAVK